MNKKVFLSLRETPRDCKITENTPNHQIVYLFFIKTQIIIDFHQADVLQI